MGLGPFSRCSGHDDPTDTVEPRKLPNPDPHNFNIEKFEQVGKYAVIRVKYPDCTNYEGRKILVFESTVEEVLKQKVLDPHFCDDGHLSPIARFEPTEKGWDLAKKMCK